MPFQTFELKNAPTIKRLDKQKRDAFFKTIVDAFRGNTHVESFVLASDSHLDLDHAPYGLYGVEYIDLVSLRQDGGQ